MPRHRIDHSAPVYVIPDDFPQRLERFQRESGLSWAEIARRLETSPLNLWRWREGVRPQRRHLMALLDLAEELGLLHLFTDWTIAEETRSEEPSPGAPPVRWNPGREPAARRSG